MKNLVLIIVFIILSININAQQRGQMGQGRQGGQGMRQNGNSQQRPTPEQMFERLDKNSDGLIDKSEVSEAKKGKLSENFDVIDANSDGYIDINELKEGGKGTRKSPQNAKQLINKIDSNKDGKIDKLEVAASNNLAIKNSFSKIDKDSDGFITKPEIDSFFNKSKSRRKNKRTKE